MKIIHILLIIIFSFFISSTDYHGYLYDINCEYLSGDFIFDESMLPIDTSKFKSFQLRHPESLDSMLVKKININLKIEYENIIHIKITDSNNPDRWEVPLDYTKILNQSHLWIHFIHYIFQIKPIFFLLNYGIKIISHFILFLVMYLYIQIDI